MSSLAGEWLTYQRGIVTGVYVKNIFTVVTQWSSLICVKVKLPRDYIKLSPISSTIIPHTTPDGRLAKTGYVKLTAFSQVSVCEKDDN